MTRFLFVTVLLIGVVSSAQIRRDDVTIYKAVPKIQPGHGRSFTFDLETIERKNFSDDSKRYIIDYLSTKANGTQCIRHFLNTFAVLTNPEIQKLAESKNAHLAITIQDLVDEKRYVYNLSPDEDLNKKVRSLRYDMDQSREIVFIEGRTIHYKITTSTKCSVHLFGGSLMNGTLNLESAEMMLSQVASYLKQM